MPRPGTREPLLPLRTTGDLGRSWSATQLLVVVLCVAVNMLDGMDVLIMSYVAPTLQAEWQLGSDQMGVIFSAGIAGMAIGGLLIAPLADLFGRRPLILMSLALSSISMILSGFVSTVPQMLALRLLVGIGIGTVLAGMAALIAEYAPDRDRNFALGMLYAGYPLGAIITGLVAVWAIPDHGWRVVLSGAGVISLAAWPWLWIMLPESMDFLHHRRPAGALERINTILGRLQLPPLEALPPIRSRDTSRTGIPGLFAGGRTVGTLLLWSATITGFMSLWFIISWIPKLALLSGLSARQSILAGTCFNVGALLGTILLGWIARHLRLQQVIPAFLLAAAVAMICFGSFRMSVPLVLFTAFAIGVFLQGGFNGIYPLAARLYPATVRSTGIGWATGIGRIGAVAGPALGGLLLERQLPLWLICAVYAVPAILGGICAAFVQTDRMPRA